MAHTFFPMAISLLAATCAASALAQGTGESDTETAITPRSGGIPNYIPLWTSPTTLGVSVLYQTGRQIGIGTKTPKAPLDVRAHSLVPGINAIGAGPPPGSQLTGSDGIDATGGSADVDSGVSPGGAGVSGKGGPSSQISPTAGPGGVFMGGNGGGGDGVDAGCPSSCYAGYFAGNVQVTGTLSAATKNFVVDHPEDPANKFLQHAAVESSEMKNIYDGTVLLDASGEAIVRLPDWFEAENENFRYQLTSVGAPSPGLYVAKKISGNQFAIAGGAPGVEVSWQITGVRHDAFARANPLVVEQEKSDRERGRYLHPALYGEPETKSLARARLPKPIPGAESPTERRVAAQQ